MMIAKIGPISSRGRRCRSNRAFEPVGPARGSSILGNRKERLMPLVVAGAGWLRYLACCFLLSAATLPALAQLDPQTRKLSRDIFEELVEINTTDSVGNTTVAATAMAQRLLDAGFAKEDVLVLGPNDRKGNLVARFHGTG